MPDVSSPAAPSRAEREKMLAGVDKLIWSLARRGGLPSEEDVEDAVQEGRMLAWELTLKFDPTRGTKWSTYAHTALARLLGKQAGTVKCKATLQLPDGWDAAAEVVNPTEDEPAESDTEGQLFDAVQRQLVGGLLDALTPLPSKGNSAPRPAAVLTERDLVEAVAFGGVTCNDMAIQVGQEPKAVRTRLKNAIRRLKRKGLTQHVATDAEVEAILVPDLAHAEKSREQRRRRRNRNRGVAVEGQEPAYPVTPAEPQTAA